VAEAGLGGDEVVGERDEDEGPEEEHGGGDAAAEGEGESEDGEDVGDAVIDVTDDDEVDAFGGRVGDGAPEEIEALEGKLKETDGVSGDPCLGELALLAGVGRFAELGVGADFGFSVDGFAPGEAHRFRVVAGVEFRPEVAAEGDEGVEDAVVADHPWGNDGDEDEAGHDGAEEDGAGGRAGKDPYAADGQEEQEGGVGETDEGPEESEEEPVFGGLVRGCAGCAAYAAHFDGEGEDGGKEHAGEGDFPDPADGVLHGGGIEGPYPRGPEGNAAVVAAVGDEIDEDGGGGGEDGVEREDDPAGERGVDSAELEDSGEQQRIEGRDPGGGAGVSVEGIGVAVSGGEGAGDAAHFVAEGEVVLEGVEAVGVGDGDEEDAEEQGREEDGARRGEDFFLARGKRDGGAEGQGLVL